MPLAAKAYGNSAHHGNLICACIVKEMRLVVMHAVDVHLFCFVVVVASIVLTSIVQSNSALALLIMAVCSRCQIIEAHFDSNQKATHFIYIFNMIATTIRF